MDDITQKFYELETTGHFFGSNLRRSSLPNTGPMPKQGGKINLLNVGKSNLYLWGFDIPENNQRFAKPRLISAGTSDAAYYWIDPPTNLNKIDVGKKYEFSIKLYLTDEFNQKWISEHGGEAEATTSTQNNDLIKTVVVKIWSYNTSKMEWSF